MSDSTQQAHALDPALLSAYYDETLDDDERREVEEHLARCSACRERLASYATLGGGIRAGANPPVPPTLDLKAAKLLKRRPPGRTVERPRVRAPAPRRRGRNWPVWSALAAVVLLGLLAGTFFFGLPFGGGGIGPTVAAAYPCDNPTECAIAVRFNGPVDHTAVERSFRIDPAVPVTFTWQADTLYVKPTQPLQAAVSYTVSLQLGSASQRTASPAAAKGPPVALHFVARGAGSPVAMASAAGGAAAPIPTGTTTPVAQANPPTATPGAPPTPSPTPPPAARTAIVAVPAASATPCPIQPVRGFGTLYHSQPKVAARLGCARHREAGMDLIAESFQHGHMLWLGDRQQIVALLDDGHWSSYPDTFNGTETVTPTPGEPVRGFGRVWRDTPKLRDAIGATTAPEQTVGAAVEDFEHGTLVWTADRTIYVLYADNTWEKYADTFVDLTPTPATGSPAAAASVTVTMTPTEATSGTPSPTPSPSTTPSESVTPTPTASGNSSPTPAATASAAPVNAACPIRPVRGFALVYDGHPDVAAKLGCASAGEIGAQATRETFEHGLMIRRDDVRQIFVIRADGTWAVFPDTYKNGDTLPSPGQPPAGKLAPVGGLAKVWLEQSGVRQALGWATAAEGTVDGAYQGFAAGQLVWTSDRTVYALYADGTWSSFQDTFVDPTATPAPH